jgi:hypothetical protein
LEKAKKYYDSLSTTLDGEDAMVISYATIGFASAAIFCVILFIVLPIRRHLKVYLARIREEEELD